jgi:hypothetical protein
VVLVLLTEVQAVVAVAQETELAALVVLAL